MHAYFDRKSPLPLTVCNLLTLTRKWLEPGIFAPCSCLLLYSWMERTGADGLAVPAKRPESHGCSDSAESLSVFTERVSDFGGRPCHRS